MAYVGSLSIPSERLIKNPCSQCINPGHARLADKASVLLHPEAVNSAEGTVVVRVDHQASVIRGVSTQLP